MRQFVYITNPIGIHTRLVGLLIKAIKALDSTVTISKGGEESAVCTKLMALMELGTK